MEYSITILLITVMLGIALAIFFAPWVVLKYYNKDKKIAYLSKVMASGKLTFISIKTLTFCLIMFSLELFSGNSFVLQEFAIMSTIYIFLGIGLGHFEWKQRVSEYEHLKT